MLDKYNFRESEPKWEKFWQENKVNEFDKNSKKEILTNGILIDKMDDEFWRTIKNANIEFGITKYPINIDQDIIEKNPKNLALIITMMLLNLISYMI